jgi:hypothetical protein
VPKYASNLVAFLTDWALDCQLCNRTVFQAGLRFSLQDGGWECCILILTVLVAVGLRMVLVLLGVDAEALCHEINFDAFDVLNQTRDWREELLHDVPVHIWHELSSGCYDFVKGVGLLLELGLVRDWLLFLGLIIV